MEHPIEFPTYEEHIRELFTPSDIGCMAAAMDLATYEGVMDKADRILTRVKAGTMPPPDQNRRWSDNQVKTFENWIDNGYQRVPAYRIRPDGDTRVRKDLLDLSGDELDLLKTAFAGLQARDADPDDKFSFFNLAAIHWYPGPRRYIHCRHHDNEYNTWHRAYLIAFEDALRSVEGCEHVTLPYWNILGVELPTWLYEFPFYPYAYPRDLLDYTGTNVSIQAGRPIHRFSATTIRDGVFSQLSPVAESIATAMSATTWEKFNGWSGAVSLHNAIIEAHDNGHGYCGNTIGNQATAAFDPLFWFFHCNWDRLWWQWQVNRDATTYDGFKATLEEDDAWLANVPQHILKPFNVTSADMLTLSDWGVDYAAPVMDEEGLTEAPVAGSGSVPGAREFSIASSDVYSVRVKNIDRLKIAGSFQIDLVVNSKVVRSTRVFQPVEVDQCDNCSNRGVFSKDFILDKDELPADAPIEIAIHKFLEDGATEKIPLSAAGSPTVNVRLLLQQN